MQDQIRKLENFWPVYVAVYSFSGTNYYELFSNILLEECKQF